MAWPRRSFSGSQDEGGFSMVEMLMAAFILAVGVLGIAMLQTLALSSRGNSKSMMTATRLGECIMDQVEEEGRSTWLNINNSQASAPGNLPNLLYFPAGALPDNTQYFDVNGGVLPTVGNSFFTAMVVGRAVPNLGAAGKLADVTVTVNYIDTLGANNLPIIRQVVITRRILHA